MALSTSRPSAQRTVEPALFEVIWNRLLRITEEMGIVYFRTSGSHVLITGNDAGTAILREDGSTVCVGPYLLMQVGVLDLIVKSTVERCSENPGIHDGDVFICNDPYLGAVHQADVATLAPVFHDGMVVAWLAASGHQLDIGGMDPGGFSVKAVEVHQEGLRIPPVAIVERGRLREDIFGWILNQVRDPLVGLDIKAQLAALQLGRAEFEKLLTTHGADTVRAVMSQAIAMSEDGMRRRISQLPDGAVREIQHIDHDGHEDKIYSIVCTATKQESHLVLDFEGTSRQAPGLINCSYGGLRAGVLSSLFILLAYDLPWNEGIWNAIEVRAPDGVVNNCSYPAPVSMGTISATVVTIDAVFGAIAKLMLASPDLREEAMACWTGSSMAPIFSGTNRLGVPFACTEMSHFAGGGGARVYKDGVDTAGVVFNTTPNISNIEETEAEFPVLYLFRRQLQDSGGPGKFRGGVSGEVAYTVYDAPRDDLEALFVGTGAEMPNAYGLSGGFPGAAVSIACVRSTDIVDRLENARSLPASLPEIHGDIEWLLPKHPRGRFRSGDVWYHNWQGAGGYGDPLDREPSSVLRDVRYGTVSLGAARAIYGVVLDYGQTRVDVEQTERMRREIRCARLEKGTAQSRATSGWTDAVVRIDENVVLDVVRGTFVCYRCGVCLGKRGSHYIARGRSVRAPLTAGGPGRGEIYRSRSLSLRITYCPGCGSQLSVDVRNDGDPEPYVVFFEPGEDSSVRQSLSTRTGAFEPETAFELETALDHVPEGIERRR